MRTKHYKVISLSTFLIVITLLGLQYTNNIELEPLNSETLLTYQKNSCEISLYKFLLTNGLSEIFIFQFDGYSNMNCFGKIKYIEPVKNSYLVLIGTHTLINLVLQSFFWLTLILTIKKDFHTTRKYSIFKILLTTVIFASLFISESSFNSFSNTTYSPKLVLGNYLAYSYFFSIYLIVSFINKLLSVRRKLLINYFPYLFLIGGVYQNLNLNFFVIVFVFFGFYNLLNINISKSLLLLTYLFVTGFWVLSDKNQYGYLDIDKLRGFVSSSNSSFSIFFWSLIFFLLLNGIIYLIKEGTTNFELLFNNFLKSSFLIVLFGIIASLSNFINLILFYFFGQNKQSKLGLDSVAGNTWRGFSPSAEGIGEFYGVVLLLSFWVIFVKKINFSFTQYIYLIFTIYGFYRANNIAALISLTVIIVVILLNKNIANYRLRNMLYFFLAVLFIISSYFILRQNTYAEMGSGVVFESWQNSKLFDAPEVDSDKVDKLLKGKDFKTLLSIYKNKGVVSSSLLVITKTLISESNIRFLPNPVALVGLAGVFINRAEKWGLFFASYNPSLNSALLGSGPFNISNYYYDQNLFDGSLILPHSSLLSYIIFLGIIPVFVICTYLIILIFRKFNLNDINFYIVVYLFVNLLKSDSLLYLSSFVMFIYFIRKLNEKKELA